MTNCPHNIHGACGLDAEPCRQETCSIRRELSDAERIRALEARIAEFERWARAMCRADCSLLLARYGRNSPNCPVADLGVGDAENGDD